MKKILCLFLIPGEEVTFLPHFCPGGYDVRVWGSVRTGTRKGASRKHTCNGNNPGIRNLKE